MIGTYEKGSISWWRSPEHTELAVAGQKKRAQLLETGTVSRTIDFEFAGKDIGNTRGVIVPMTCVADALFQIIPNHCSAALLLGTTILSLAARIRIYRRFRNCVVPC